MIRSRHLLGASFCALWLVGLIVTTAQAAAPGIAGRWQLNDALTREANPPEKRSNSTFGGFGAPTLVVGGMPVPIPGTGGSQPGIGGSSPDPAVLRAIELAIQPAGDRITLEYVGAATETLGRGNVQGQKSSWDERMLKTSYETTTRKVSQVYEVDADGRLRVEVKLNPNQGRTQKHYRVFDRVTP